MAVQRSFSKKIVTSPWKRNPLQMMVWEITISQLADVCPTPDFCFSLTLTDWPFWNKSCSHILARILLDPGKTSSHIDGAIIADDFCFFYMYLQMKYASMWIPERLFTISYRNILSKSVRVLYQHWIVQIWITYLYYLNSSHRHSFLPHGLNCEHNLLYTV